MNEIVLGTPSGGRPVGTTLSAAIRRASALATTERDLAARERARATTDLTRADGAPDRSRAMHLRAAAMHERAAHLHDTAAQLQDLHRTHLLELSPEGDGEGDDLSSG